MKTEADLQCTVVLDSSFLIAYCAKEPGRFARAAAEYGRYASEGREFFAPGVAAAEALSALCRKLQEGSLTIEEHSEAVQTLVLILSCTHTSPSGDLQLTERAEQIRAGYGCSRSADGIFIALCEELARHGRSEIATFDDSMRLQAAANAPTVSINTLI
jgi:predicted nucleic acid-binding protein